MKATETEIAAAYDALWKAHGAVSLALAHFGAVTTQTQVEPEQRREAEKVCLENLRRAMQLLGDVKMPAALTGDRS